MCKGKQGESSTTSRRLLRLVLSIRVSAAVLSPLFARSQPMVLARWPWEAVWAMIQWPNLTTELAPTSDQCLSRCAEGEG